MYFEILFISKTFHASAYLSIQGGAGNDTSLGSHQSETSRRALGYFLVSLHCFFRPLYHSAATRTLSNCFKFPSTSLLIRFAMFCFFLSPPLLKIPSDTFNLFINLFETSKRHASGHIDASTVNVNCLSNF